MARQSSKYGTTKRSRRSSNARHDAERPERDEPDPEEELDPEEEPGWLARIGTGWKGVSGVIATIGTAVGILATTGLIGGGGGAVGPSDAIASAASTTAAAGSSTLQTTLIKTPPGGAPHEVKGKGEFDYRAGRGRMEFDFSRTPGMEDAAAVEVIFNGPAFYLHDPGVLGLPRRTPWLSVAFADLQRIDPSSSLQVLSDVKIDDPAQAVKSLDENSSGAKKVGKETIYDVETTHYRALRDPDGTGPAAATTFDLWVDEADHLRKVETTLQDSSGTTKTITELDSFGIGVDAPVPPSSKVISFARYARGD